MRYITRGVWILSLVSLFTDMASEMLYPIMPVYLKSIGFSVLLIGILEGIVEATAGLSKGYFGKLSDLSGKRVPFVRAGYALSAISKPMLAFYVYPLWILFARTADRLGKGIRTGARDAMLSDESNAATKGRIFGFHRSLDTLGAVIGPALALLYLHYHPENYVSLFYLAFIPGLLAVAATFFLKPTRPRAEWALSRKKLVSVFSFLSYWKKGPKEYRRLITGLLLFALFNSSDVFLLLKAKEIGLDDTTVISVYIFYNLIFALFAFPVGILSDKLGLKRTFLAGLMLFAIVYFGMGLTDDTRFVFILFFLYGIYAAATEGIAKAWISNIAASTDTATAIGTYTALQSICALVASTLAGLLWFVLGAPFMFMFTAIASILVFLYISVWVRGPAR